MPFWPEDLKAIDLRSPKAIMVEARDELPNFMETLIALIDTVALSDRVVHTFIVTNPTKNSSISLFEAAHGPHEPYPVAITPLTQDVPEYLKEAHKPVGPLPFTLPSALDLLRGTQFEQQKAVELWICSTPQEFTNKIKQLFREPYVKGRLISLATPSAR